MDRNCSDTNRVIGFNVAPGQSYNYSVVIGNDVGPYVYSHTG